MVRVQPFAAVRPLPNLAARVASVPYDVVNVAEAQQLAADNPYSFLHVIRSEIDLPADTDPHGAAVYEKAAETFQRFQDEGTLIRDGVPNLYLYRLVWEGRAQTGLVGCFDMDIDEIVVRERVEAGVRLALEIGVNQPGRAFHLDDVEPGVDPEPLDQVDRRYHRAGDAVRLHEGRHSRSSPL